MPVLAVPSCAEPLDLRIGGFPAEGTPILEYAGVASEDPVSTGRTGDSSSCQNEGEPLNG